MNFDDFLRLYGSHLAILILVVGVIWQFWPILSTIVTKSASGINLGSLTTAQTDGQKAFIALEWLDKHYTKSNCVEGKQAVRVCLQHLLDTEGDHA